jgi:hypothetical protein
MFFDFGNAIEVENLKFGFEGMWGMLLVSSLEGGVSELEVMVIGDDLQLFVVDYFMLCLSLTGL